MSNMSLMVPHTFYGIGILWSPLTYMEQVSYGPLYIYIWSLPHVKFLHILYDSYGPPHTLHGISIVWSPQNVLYEGYGPPYDIWNRYLMVPSYLMWNRYLMVPLTLYGKVIIWSPHVCMVPPHM